MPANSVVVVEIALQTPSELAEDTAGEEVLRELVSGVLEMVDVNAVGSKDTELVRTSEQELQMDVVEVVDDTATELESTSVRELVVSGREDMVVIKLVREVVSVS